MDRDRDRDRPVICTRRQQQGLVLCREAERLGWGCEKVL